MLLNLVQMSRSLNARLSIDAIACLSRRRTKGACEKAAFTTTLDPPWHSTPLYSGATGKITAVLMYEFTPPSESDDIQLKVADSLGNIYNLTAMETVSPTLASTDSITATDFTLFRSGGTTASDFDFGYGNTSGFSIVKK